MSVGGHRELVSHGITCGERGNFARPAVGARRQDKSERISQEHVSGQPGRIQKQSSRSGSLKSGTCLRVISMATSSVSRGTQDAKLVFD